MSRIVIVTGSRHALHTGPIDRVLDELLASDPGRVTLYEGGARGVDAIAHAWAERNASRVECVTFEADWEQHGKAAGGIRNQRMVDMALNVDPAVQVRVSCLAFPGPSSKGTWDMVRRCNRANIPVVIHRLERKDEVTRGDE